MAETIDSTAGVAALPNASSAKLKIFVSYSRKDIDFTRRLADELAQRGYAPNFDQSIADPDNITSGIAAEDEWWQRLQHMIAAADVMVFVVSPDSADSKVCDEEIACSRGLGKRIIAILRRPIDFAKAPPRLSALNVKLDFTSGKDEEFLSATDDLCRALDLNVGWYRENTRISVLQQRWELADRPDALLLSASDVEALGRLLEDRPRDAPEPSTAILEFRDQSRARLIAERDRQRRIIGRAFVKPAEEANTRGEHEHALRLAATGALLAEDLHMKLVPELWPVAARAMLRNRTKCILFGHTSTITTASFSPNGRRIVTGSVDATARLWDSDSGAEIAVFKAHSRGITSAAFSPNGERVLIASIENAFLWDAETRAVAVLKGHTLGIESAAFSPNDKSAATGSWDNTARLWDAESGAETFVLKAHTGCVRSVSFSPDGKRVVTGSSDKTARLWDVESGAEIAVLNAHTGGIYAASFSPDGKRVVTASDDNTARLWDAESGSEIAVLNAHTASIETASFSPDGKRVLTASYDHTARLWDAESGAGIAVLNAHTRAINAASFSPDGKRVVTGSSDNTARLWDAESGTEIARLNAHTDAVLTTSFSHDGKCVVTGSSDNTARLWDAASGIEIAYLKGRTVSETTALFSPNGKSVAMFSDETTRILDVETGLEISHLRGHIKGIRTVSFNRDGDRVLSGSDDHTARLWDPESGTEIAVMRGHTQEITAASFSPDGARFATGSWDKTVRVWDTETGAQIAVLNGHPGTIHSASFSYDGKCVVTGALEAMVHFWDGSKKTSVIHLNGHTAAVNATSISFDGKHVVTGSDDNTARLWDIETGIQTAVLKGHTGVVNSVSFSPEGTRVVTGSWDNTARLWDIDSFAEIAVLKANTAVCSASFNTQGNLVVTGLLDGTARISDVSRTRAIVHPRALVLAAALARGIGWRTAPEQADLLMQGLPHDDMFAQALHQLGRAPDDPELQHVIAALRAPLHSNCYLSPTQFAEKFGLELPEAAAAKDKAEARDDSLIYNTGTGDVEHAEEDEVGIPTTAASPRLPVTADALAGQEFVETHLGVAIFRLADGRYHIVSHFAVSSLDEARAAAEALAAATN